MDTYYLRQANSGTIHSGLSRSDLQQMAESGQIDPKDEIRKSGHKTWHVVTTVNGLSLRQKTNDCNCNEDSHNDLENSTPQAIEKFVAAENDFKKPKNVPTQTGEYSQRWS